MQKNYELALILKSALVTKEKDAILDMVGKTLKLKSADLKMTEAGKKLLAYPIGKEKDGQYFFMQFSAEGSGVKELSSKLRQNPNVVRYLLLHDNRKIKKEKAAKGSKKE